MVRILIVGFCILAAACSEPVSPVSQPPPIAPPPPMVPPPPPPAAVTQSIDTSVTYTTDQGLSRTVDIRVWYRANQENSTPLPLIVVSHGGSGSVGAQTRFEFLAEEYSLNGYVTAVLNHPVSPNGGAFHRLDRPADVSNAVDHLSTFELPADFLGVIDTDNVGHIGHSFGAYTSHAVGGATFTQGSFGDPRIKAIVPLSPQGVDGFGAFDNEPDIRLPSTSNSWTSVTIPAYNMFGEIEKDGRVTEIFRSDDWRGFPYARYTVRDNKFLSIVPDGEHSDFGNNARESFMTFIALNTRLFFDLYLRGLAVDPCEIGSLSPPLGARTIQDDVHGCTAVFASRSAFSDLVYSKDWTPGTADPNGSATGGTETISIRAHDGALFAATGFLLDDGSGPPDDGPMVLRKDTFDGPWFVDNVWPIFDHTRIDAMEQLTFTLRIPSASRPRVVRRLAVGVDDPFYLSLWFRDDSTGDYTQSIISPSLGDSVSAMEVSFDLDTDQQSLFIGSVSGEIYRGIVTSTDPMTLTWERENIQGRTSPSVRRRILAITRADDVLYAAFGPEDGEAGGLYERVDDPVPFWRLVSAIPFSGSEPPSPDLRGLTAFADRSAPFTDRILGTATTDESLRIYDALSFMEIIVANIAAFLTADVEDRTLNTTGLSAYNRFTRAIDPDTDERVHLFGALAAPGSEAANTFNTQPPDNGTYLLARREDGSLEQTYVYDFSNPVENGESLRAVRTVAISPFPEDGGRVIYVGGYDASFDPARLKHNTAWIYRGVTLD